MPLFVPKKKVHFFEWRQETHKKGYKRRVNAFKSKNNKNQAEIITIISEVSERIHTGNK
jgi:hypothetical protein